MLTWGITAGVRRFDGSPENQGRGNKLNLETDLKHTYICEFRPHLSTYDHIQWKPRDPVRSPLDKPLRGGLVVGSVTTSESPLLYVSFFLLLVEVLLSFSGPTRNSRCKREVIT